MKRVTIKIDVSEVYDNGAEVDTVNLGMSLDFNDGSLRKFIVTTQDVADACKDWSSHAIAELVESLTGV